MLPRRVCPACPAWRPQPGRRALGLTFFLMGFFFSVRLLTFDHDRCMSASSIFSDIDLARAICSSPSPAIAADHSAEIAGEPDQVRQYRPGVAATHWGGSA